ncbi:protein ABIL1-like isoform X2 [Coffea eugenioides]|uniref:protein ABIL1-like isoform X2 n=1 Tax=Coffea eugenioides TaxID=49369 RepID=UPI000F609AD0|nr:protein ABIL1-like isoform X2 [Coffea eugenioides]
MNQQDSKSLAAENQEAETDEGTQFEKSLLELKDLCSHLRRAANYCETSFSNAKEKRTVVENTKEYISRAVVTVVDHLGSVSANLECRLLNTNSVSETELRIDSLKERIGTWEKYSHLLALRSHCWNADFPRYHCRYILPPSPGLQRTNTTVSRQIAARTAEFQTGEVPLFLYTHNCKPSLVENPTSDESSEKRKSFSIPVLPVRDGLPVKYQHPNFHFQESPKLKRSMLSWKLAQNKDLRSVFIRRGGSRSKDYTALSALSLHE